MQNIHDSSITRREFIGTLGALALPMVADAAPADGELNLLAMGDWGAPPNADDPADTPRKIKAQNRVAAMMGDYANKSAAAGSRINAVLAMGDNFYADLKKDALKENDVRFATRFEDLYPKAVLDVPFYFALGNHDYEDGDRQGWKYQMAYAAKSSTQEPKGRWTFPAKDDATWYRQDFPIEDKVLSMIVLDTNTDHVGPRWKDQIEWLEKQLEATEASRWRIVVAHHPMFTDGYHWDGKKDPSLYPKIRTTILPKLKDVVFYVSGHDHNQQHIQHPDYQHLDFLVSGAGGGDFPQSRRRKDPPYTNEFMDGYGFLHLRFTEKAATAQFIEVTSKTWKLRHTVSRIHS